MTQGEINFAYIPFDNLAWLIACDCSGNLSPNYNQLYIGFRILRRKIIHRHKIGLEVKSHMEEYREAKLILGV